MTDPLKPPRGLRAAGKRFWTEMTAEYDFEPAELQLLALLCEQLDVQAAASRTLRAEGLTITNERTGNIKPHPALAISREATRVIASLVKALQLPEDQPKLGRGLHRGARPTRGSGRVARAKGAANGAT